MSNSDCAKCGGTRVIYWRRIGPPSARSTHYRKERPVTPKLAKLYVAGRCPFCKPKPWADRD